MNEPYPIIHVAGSAAERGRQHGELARERVARSVEIYRRAFAAGPGLDWEGVLALARGFSTTIEAADPAILAEMTGIAEGAGFRPEEIVAINCRTEILFGTRAPAAAPAHECTTIAVAPRASRDGGTLVGKNWDWKAECQQSVIILQVEQDDGPAFVMAVEAGMVGRDGFNEHGIAVCGNLLRSTLDGSRPGVPVPLIRRRALNSRRLDDAFAAVLRAERAASTNYLIAHESGVIVDFEASPDQVYPVYPEHGLLTHANHFTAVAAQVQGIAREAGADSLYRDRRARDLLEPKIGDIAVADVQAALRDHVGYPKAICRHPDERDAPAQRSASIASIVIDLGRREMHVASGPPCCHDYQTVTLPGAERTGAAHARYASVTAH
jgi:isopenicillin-N N-acyltransferase-like protein